MSTASIDTRSIAAAVERDGYVVIKSFLNKEMVAQARRDLEAIYARDLEERRLRNDDTPLFTHGSSKSSLSPTSHLVMRLPGKSKALDQCYEKIFSDPATRDVVRAIAGDHIKIRDVNCRYMTGADDPGDFLNPPHEWHRDSDGEFCVAIPLSEVPWGRMGQPPSFPVRTVIPGIHAGKACSARPSTSAAIPRARSFAVDALEPFQPLAFQAQDEEPDRHLCEPAISIFS